jgi:hypothetical protein
MTQEVRNLTPVENARLNPRLDYSKDTFPLVSVVYSAQKTLLIKIAQSFALMSICWGATDFGKGKSDMLNLLEKSLLIHTVKVTTWPTKLHTWIVCCVGVLTG